MPSLRDILSRPLYIRAAEFFVVSASMLVLYALFMGWVYVTPSPLSTLIHRHMDEVVSFCLFSLVLAIGITLMLNYHYVIEKSRPND